MTAAAMTAWLYALMLWLHLPAGLADLPRRACDPVEENITDHSKGDA